MHAAVDDPAVPQQRVLVRAAPRAGLPDGAPLHQPHLVRPQNQLLARAAAAVPGLDKAKSADGAQSVTSMNRM